MSAKASSAKGTSVSATALTSQVPPSQIHEGVLTSPLVPGVTLQWELVTPERAEQYLQLLSDAQRNLSKTTAEKYAGDMLSGMWMIDGAPIRFDVDGRLADGQHRLRAILHSRESQVLLVIRGLQQDAIAVMDTGYGRRFTNLLSARGVKDVAKIHSLTSATLYWKRGNFATRNVGRFEDSPFLHVSASHQALMATFEEHEAEIIVANREGAKAHRFFFRQGGGNTASHMCFAFSHMIFSRIDLFVAEQFFKELVEGPASNEISYPITALRNKLLRGDKQPSWVWLAWFVSTWGRWVRGENGKPLVPPLPPFWRNLPAVYDPKAEERPEGWVLL